jgi:predicted membrane-bound spermidine synthase
MYEIVWVRQFTHVLGTSSTAVTITLASFMAGLGLGARLFGSWADRRDEQTLVKAYVLLEVGIGAYGLLLPFLLDSGQWVYVAFFHAFQPTAPLLNGLRIVLAFLLLLVPTTLIGGTLPVLSRFIIRRRETISVTVAQLYAVNTLGAILGTLLAGYALLPVLGVAATTRAAVALNVTVAAWFWVLNRGGKAKDGGPPGIPVEPRSGRGRLSRAQRVLLGALFFSGAAAMLYEVAWTRTLQMILGTTTFAFTTMLATFLLGIALGSALYGKIRRRISAGALFVALQLVITFSVLLTIPLFETLPFVFVSAHDRWVDSWGGMQVLRFAISAMIMLVPCLAMGTLLPAVSALTIERTGHLGRRLGHTYSWNTLGNVTGAVAGGLVLVPLLGMQKTLMVGATLNLLAAGSVLLGIPATGLGRRRTLAGGSALLLCLLLFFMEPWAPRVMSSGVYLYAPRYQTMLDRYETAAERRDGVPELPGWKVLEKAMKRFDLLYYDPGVGATVAVMEQEDGVRFLTIDGKTDASTGVKSDMKTQVMIAQLPLLFHPDPDEVLIVGLGSGITAGSVLTHDVRVVDCAEISPGVIRAARHFSESNHHALEDRRLKILRRDARNVLLTQRDLYDVVISQPSNPWISGESSLFTLEWYRLVRERLQEGGLFLQWVPSYLMGKRDLKVIIHTLKDVFPHLSVWTSGSLGDLIFIARKGTPLTVDYDAFVRRVRPDRVRKDIERVGLDPRLLPMELFVMNEEELSRYLHSTPEAPLPKNTDDHLITEFSTPKQLFRRNNVDRFQEPKRLHGKMESLADILERMNAEELKKGLGRGAECRT